jgi:hypothetical protein
VEWDLNGTKPVILKTAVEMAAKDHKEHKENRIQGKRMSWTHTCRVTKIPGQLCFKILTLRSLRSLAANHESKLRSSGESGRRFGCIAHSDGTQTA